MEPKTKTFKVPLDILPDFARMINDYDLPCSLIDATRKDKILVEVEYEADEKQYIHELTYLIDDYLQEEDSE